MLGRVLMSVKLKGELIHWSGLQERWESFSNICIALCHGPHANPHTSNTGFCLPKGNSKCEILSWIWFVCIFVFVFSWIIRAARGCVMWTTLLFLHVLHVPSDLPSSCIHTLLMATLNKLTFVLGGSLTPIVPCQEGSVSDPAGGGHRPASLRCAEPRPWQSWRWAFTLC